MVGRVASQKREDDGEIRKTKLSHQIEEQPRNNVTGSDSESEEDGDARPIGDVIRVSDNGVEKNYHFRAFQFFGNQYNLEDNILVTPDEGKVKPSVATIKDIFQIDGDYLMVRAQRFYRPEEVKKTGSGTWESGDARELFYSWHLDEVPANAVMHECVIHLLPHLKPLPDRKKRPGFIVRKFYDYVNQKVRNLTEKDCKSFL